jgi:hypothetical protein
VHFSAVHHVAARYSMLQQQRSTPQCSAPRCNTAQQQHERLQNGGSCGLHQHSAAVPHTRCLCRKYAG